MKQHHASRIQIGSFANITIDRAGLLRRHVPHGAPLSFTNQTFRMEAPHHSDVDQLRPLNWTVMIDDDVGWLNIPVENAMAMQLGEGREEAFRDNQRLGDREWTGIEPHAQVNAIDDGHYQIEFVIDSPKIGDRSDPIVLQRATNGSFVLETCSGPSCQRFLADNFDDDSLSRLDVLAKQCLGLRQIVNDAQNAIPSS